MNNAHVDLTKKLYHIFPLFYGYINITKESQNVFVLGNPILLQFFSQYLRNLT